MKFKFAIGEIVAIMGAVERFLISEIYTVTCSAGTQIFYKGFFLMPSLDYDHELKKTTIKWHMSREGQMNEVLLEKVK